MCLLIIYQQLTDFTVPKWLRLIIFNYIQKQTTGTCTIQTVWLDQIFKAISKDKYKLDTCIIFSKRKTVH